MEVEPKPAASLVVMRMQQREVLMGMRGAGHKFMPNRLVYPGGRVDPEDHTATPATPLPTHVLRRLERAATPELARAIGMAAARELEEETGLTLGNPPALDGLDYLCRAITPENSPIRFDARFLIVDAARVGGTLAGSGELEDLRWYPVDDVLALDIAFATRSVLGKALEWLALSPDERAAIEGVPTIRNRGWVVE
jgi:8-oxo-dGTP pyrophosphatase MutT (NUDIX family)